ncbi:syntaxin-12 [Drosophila rhopaloa]|uniref:t-SNARE coiled-coil homology domain-containing protein n=2 Tax=Drosophila rhopaloa TaxID=1041015 RepID=A0ABM5J4L0_DRORH|nr:syntaxin-12 [Drosophila rhopaloa]XP_044313753.1 syntaxin-12 [Drosophila rhopaloa]
MSQALNNPAGGGGGGGGPHRDYGAMADVTPEVSFAAAGGSSGFSPTEFMSLSEDIGHNITAVHSSTKQLEKQLKLIGTPKELPNMREKVHSINTKSNARVQTTSQDLQRLQAVVRHGDRQQKLQLENLTREFHGVIEKYSSLQRRISSAMRQTLQQAQQFADQDGEPNARAELLQQQRLEQAHLQQEHDILDERRRQVEQIESDIIDVNQIMTRLSGLVHDQGQQMDFIENSIEQTAANVEDGTSQLQKAARSRQSYRRKILILLVIAVIIGLIVTGVIVAKLNS